MQSIFAIIQTNENMSSMMKCVRATDLQNKLNKPDFFYTVFAFAGIKNFVIKCAQAY